MQYVRVAVHGLIKKNGKILVTKRPFDDDYMPMLWDIPGGTIKFQENANDALVREINEETKLKVKIGNIIFCHDFPSGPERHQFQMVYECEYESGEVILNPDDHYEFKWVSLDEIEQLPKIALLEELFKFLKK
ncbi:MAG: NUDIX domain-containing protein [Candidatus Shapirobacteria bacterium]|jgi:8-oxo-dGTP diphosphatase